MFFRFRRLLLKSVNKLPFFFTDKGAFWTSYFFFPKVMLEIGGAAYTQVQLIHESLRYMYVTTSLSLCRMHKVVKNVKLKVQT